MEPKSFLTLLKPQKSAEAKLDEIIKMEESLYVTKCIKTRHAMMFHLSNNMVQAIFDDKSEITLNKL